jgi:hypothetical protein
MTKRYHWTDGSGRINLVLTDDDLDCVRVCGDQETDLWRLESMPHIAEQVATWDKDQVRSMLAEYSAWDHFELMNDPRNITRVVWLAVSDVRDYLENWSEE